MCRMYPLARLVIWKEYDNEIDVAVSHLEKNGILLWGTSRCLNSPLIAVKKKGPNDIVALMFSEDCKKREEVMDDIEKKNGTWIFKEGRYKGKEVMPQQWYVTDIESGQYKYYLFIVGIVGDICISEDRIYNREGEPNRNWNPGAWICIR